MNITMLCTYLVDIKVEHVFEVLWLAGDEEIEAPAPAEVSDDDGVDGPRREELLPWRLQALRSTITVRETEQLARIAMIRMPIT